MLDRELVEEVLRAARVRGGDFAEVFVEERSSVSIRLDDGKIEELTNGLDRGAGVRVARGTSFGYAFSNRLDRDALLDTAAAAAACDALLLFVFALLFVFISVGNHSISSIISLSHIARL